MQITLTAEWKQEKLTPGTTLQELHILDIGDFRATVSRVVAHHGYVWEWATMRAYREFLGTGACMTFAMAKRHAEVVINDTIVKGVNE